jgi:hypothetical protein
MMFAILALAFWGCGDDDTTDPQVPGNQAPGTPSNPSPVHLTINQEIDIQLSWDCTDPDTLDTLTFDLYFGHAIPPPLIDSDLTLTTYDPGQLVWGYAYYWQVIAKDNHGHSTAGPPWVFATRATGVYSFGSYATPTEAYFVTVSGNYAYVGTYNSGMIILDISDPANPDSVGSYDTPGHTYDIFLLGNKAYLADYNGGLQIVNVTNPASPSLVGSYPSPAGSRSVYVVNDTAYVADQYGGLLIIDAATNPSSPSLITSYTNPAKVYGVYVSGNYAYLATPDSGLVIVDISNPASPSFAGKYQVNLAFDVCVEGDYAFLTDWQNGLRIINVSNPNLPTLAGFYDTPYKLERLSVSGDYALLAHFDWGLYLLDISTLGNPTLIDTLDLPTASGHGKDVFMSGDYIYMAGHVDGVQVYRYVHQ